MKIMDYMERYDYEQVVFCTDRGVGLKAIIVIHDTTLGPALGGIRMWPYQQEEDAIMDVLRLARAMTYKASAAGLDLGGGKAVILGDPANDKSEGLFRSLGRFIESLHGRYITTEDVGTSERDMEYIKSETDYVTGLPLSWGASGDPSPLTALGVYRGMKACAKEVLSSESLHGKSVALQGLGKVGYHLAGHLREEGAEIMATDINEMAAKKAREEFGIALVRPEEIYGVECDIFSPCALGGILNSETIPKLKCKIVAGGANNQLLEDRHGEELAQKGILYAPDYVVNAGGIINLSLEFMEIGYDPTLAEARVGQIYHTMERVIARAKAEGITTARAADSLAEERIERVRQARNIYLEG